MKSKRRGCLRKSNNYEETYYVCYLWRRHASHDGYDLPDRAAILSLIWRLFIVVLASTSPTHGASSKKFFKWPEKRNAL